MVKEIRKKTSVIKFEKKRVWGLTEIEFRSLFLKIKNTGTKREFLLYTRRE